MKFARLLLVALTFVPFIASANMNAPTLVKKPAFSIVLPGSLTYAAPEINTQKNLQLYSFTDSDGAPKQAMTVMVVKYDAENMGKDIDKATNDFAKGILIGYSKRDGHPITLPSAEQLIQQSQMNNKSFKHAELQIQHGIIHIYATHTQNTIYGFIFSSTDAEGVTEMRAALSSVQLLS